MDTVQHGRSVIEVELEAIRGLLERLDSSFDDAVRAILDCRGKISVTGMGKPEIIAKKISATLASTGTPSFAFHPGDACHGDLGRIVRDDLVLALSNSGETAEIVRLLSPIKRIGARLIAMTGDSRSSLARHSDIVLNIGEIDEACPIGLAPTASTTVMLVLGDALAMTVAKARNFSKEEYALYHPGGSLGRRLLKVSEIMRTGEETTVVPLTLSAREALIRINRTKGRPGAASVVDENGVLAGIVTDGDLARRLEAGIDFLGLPVAEVMGRNPKTVYPDQLASEALRLLKEFRVDQLPVIDRSGNPIGLLDVQDILDTGGV